MNQLLFKRIKKNIFNQNAPVDVLRAVFEVSKSYPVLSV